MVLPDHFEGEDVIITFEGESTDDIKNVEGKVLSWNVGGGAQNTEDVFAFGNRTFNISKQREKFTLSFEVVINNSDWDLVQFGSAASGALLNAMSGKIVKSTDSTLRWRVIFWFQTASNHKTREIAASAGNRSYKIIVPDKTVSVYRLIFTDCKSVTFDKEFEADNYFKGTLNMEFSATDSDGNANYFEQEGLFLSTTATSSQQLASLTTTASSGILREAKGYLDFNTTTPAWISSTTTAKNYRYTG
jgi:hypothetical protein